MPRRKSDATEGDAREPSASEDGPESGGADPSRDLSTPDEAAEPGAPDPAGPPPEPADPTEAIEPYREPEIVVPETAVASAEEADAGAGAVEEPAIAPPSSAAEVVEEAHEHEEEAGGSLASKLLAAVVLLLLGGGLALWGAPKLAPHLPSGMSGVADWLTPGGRDAEARIAELETRLGERLAGVEARVAELASPEEVDARIGAAVDAAATRLDAEIAAVKESVAGIGTGDLPQQLARLQSTLEGQETELETLKQQLTGTETTRGQLSEEALGRIDVYRAELDGLRAEVGTLQDRVAGLATRLDQSEQRATREIETARTRVAAIRSEADNRLSAAEAEANLALVRAALESGAPFETPLAALGERAGVSVPPTLAAAAPTGVATMARLRDDFSEAAHAAIRSSIIAGAGDGVLDRARAFFGAQMASRSLTPQEGASPDAVLSRIEDRLRRDDLDGAIREAEQLPSEAQAALGPWLAAARLRAGAVDGLAELESAVSATN
jgi:hypothetical protein